jgi:TPR repeat protein
VVQDFQEAFTWFRRAADGDEADAQNDLGTMYANGVGVGRDHDAAVRWYRRSAANGNTIAQDNLLKLGETP